MIIEDNVVTGNVYDKYGTKNPIARYLTKNMLSRLDHCVLSSQISSIHEVGCGEGELSLRYARMRYSVRASDFSSQIIEIAKRNAEEHPELNITFCKKSIYDLNPEEDSAELVICSEVLEHLEDPVQAIDILRKISKKYLLVSVPNEPIWRILNMARMSYLSSFGNTPGHIQHWSKKQFIRLMESKFSIVSVSAPLPWVVVLCKTSEHS